MAFSRFSSAPGGDTWYCTENTVLYLRGTNDTRTRMMVDASTSTPVYFDTVIIPVVLALAWRTIDLSFSAGTKKTECFTS